MNKPYTSRFSHEFEGGPSGPARSYWLIDGPGMGSHGAPICLHHRSEGTPESAIDSICHAMNTAFQEGQKDKAAEVRRVIGQ